MRFICEDWEGKEEEVNTLAGFGGGDILDLGNLFSFHVSRFEGQCGAIILHDFDFKQAFNKAKISAIRKLFTEECKRTGKGWKIFVSDVVGGSIYSLVHDHPDWEYGEVSINPNTGNKIQVFELST